MTLPTWIQFTRLLDSAHGSRSPLPCCISMRSHLMNRECHEALYCLCDIEVKANWCCVVAVRLKSSRRMLCLSIFHMMSRFHSPCIRPTSLQQFVHTMVLPTGSRLHAVVGNGLMRRYIESKIRLQFSRKKKHTNTHTVVEV